MPATKVAKVSHIGRNRLHFCRGRSALCGKLFVSLQSDKELGLTMDADFDIRQEHPSAAEREFENALRPLRAG